MTDSLLQQRRQLTLAERAGMYREFVEIGRYPNLHAAVLAHCPYGAASRERSNRYHARLYAEVQAEKRERGRQEARRISNALRREVLASGDCVYCSFEASVVEHIVPVSRGGTRRRRNLAPACRSCNDNKLDFTVPEWKAYRAEMGLPWPPESASTTLIRDIVHRYETDPEFRDHIEVTYGS